MIEDDLCGYLRAKEPGMREKAYSVRPFGFNVTNDVFAENAWYFRNALVRANYTNLPRGVHPTSVYLERFFANLLLGETNELKSRLLHVSNAAPVSTLLHRKREQVREQVKSDLIAQIRSKPSRQVVSLLSRMKGEMTVLEMMVALKLSGRRNFFEHYLSSAIELGFVEMTQPDSPRSPTQCYRLTDSGRELIAKKKIRKCSQRKKPASSDGE